MFCELPDFGRCCFCLPLRPGILFFGYLNIVFSGLMVGLYSYSVDRDFGIQLVFHGSVSGLKDGMCVAIYCIDIVFNGILVYGAHMKKALFLTWFYYFTITTSFAVVLLQIQGTIQEGDKIFEFIPLFIIGLFLNIYLLFMVRSLLRKLEMSGRTFENQLHQFVSGEIKTEENGVCPSTVVPNETA